jgi:hypothetical protein
MRETTDMDQTTAAGTPAPEHRDDPWYDDDPLTEDLPPARPRRRLLTPVNGALAAVLLAGAGFLGGVEVQKSQDGGGASAGGPAQARAGAGGAFAGRGGGVPVGGAAGDLTLGTVANKKGHTLYVTTGDGTTLKVRTNDNSKITRTASASAGAIHPGDTVVVQGRSGSDGSVTASTVRATGKGVQAGGFGGGGFGGFGGGRAPGGGGGAPGGGGAAPQAGGGS